MFSAIAAILLAVALPAAPPDGISDQAGLLSQSDHADLAGRIAQQRQQDGTQLYILTLRQSDGEDPQALSMRTLQTWGAPDRSVVITVLMDQRKVRIQPGPALAGDLNRNVSDALYRNTMATPMRGGRFAEAMRNGISGIQQHLTGSAPVQTVASSSPTAPAVVNVNVNVPQQTQPVTTVPTSQPVPVSQADSGWGFWGWFWFLTFLCVVIYFCYRMYQWWQRRTQWDEMTKDAEDGYSVSSPITTVPPVSSIKREETPKDPPAPTKSSSSSSHHRSHRRHVSPSPAPSYSPPAPQSSVLSGNTIIAPVITVNDPPPTPAPAPDYQRYTPSSPSPSSYTPSHSTSHHRKKDDDFSPGGGTGSFGNDSSGGGGDFGSGGGGGSFDSGGGSGSFSKNDDDDSSSSISSSISDLFDSGGGGGDFGDGGDSGGGGGDF